MTKQREKDKNTRTKNLNKRQDKKKKTKLAGQKNLIFKVKYFFCLPL